MSSELLKDPLYKRFDEGLRLHVAHTLLPDRWRWRPWDSSWWRYPATDWTFVALSHRAWPKAKVYLSIGEPQILPFISDLTELYQQVGSEYNVLRPSHPYCVWEPITGSWDFPQSKTSPSRSLPPERGIERLIKEVHDLESRQVLTHEEAERRIAEILNTGH